MASVGTIALGTCIGTVAAVVYGWVTWRWFIAPFYSSYSKDDDKRFAKTASLLLIAAEVGTDVAVVITGGIQSQTGGLLDTIMPAVFASMALIWTFAMDAWVYNSLQESVIGPKLQELAKKSPTLPICHKKIYAEWSFHWWFLFVFLFVIVDIGLISLTFVVAGGWIACGSAWFGGAVLFGCSIGQCGADTQNKADAYQRTKIIQQVFFKVIPELSLLNISGLFLALGVVDLVVSIGQWVLGHCNCVENVPWCLEKGETDGDGDGNNNNNTQ